MMIVPLDVSHIPWLGTSKQAAEKFRTMGLCNVQQYELVKAVLAVQSGALGKTLDDALKTNRYVRIFPATFESEVDIHLSDTSRDHNVHVFIMHLRY